MKNSSRAYSESGDLRSISKYCSFLALAASVLSFIGWMAGLTIILKMSPKFVPIAPSTALCFLLLSGSLCIYEFHPDNSIIRKLTLFSAFLTLLIGSIILISFFAGIPVEFEHLGFTIPETSTDFMVGHMSPITAINFIFTSLGIFFLILSLKRGQHYKNAAAFLALWVILIGFIVIVGYLYGTPFLYGGQIIPVALPTALTFELLGLGLMKAAGSNVPPMRFFVGPSVRSRLIRAFLPTTIAFILIQGLLGQLASPLTTNPALIASLIAIFSGIVIGAIISKMAKSIGDEIDQANVEREKKEGALQESEAKYYDLYENAPDMYYSIEALTGIIKECNNTFVRTTGFSKEEVIGHSIFEFYHSNCLEDAREGFRRLNILGEIRDAERQVKCKDGRIIYVSLNLSAVRDKNGNVIYGRSIWRDITERKKYEEMIRALSITDQLTGLYNRRGLLTLAEQQIRIAERTKSRLLLLFADMDGLKQINDTLGHAVGDQAIVEIASIFKEVFRKMDIIARMGGDEFAALTSITSVEYSDIIVNRLKNQISYHNARENRNFSLSLSIGMAYFDPERPNNLDELISRADSLMYEEKKKKSPSLEYFQ